MVMKYILIIVCNNIKVNILRKNVYIDLQIEM